MAMEHELTRSQYRWVAIGAVIIAATGFARTYYLRFLFHTPVLPPLVQIHGAIMTLWCVGFVVQTWLIEARQIRLHQRLGIGMSALAAIVVLLGEILTINGVAREGRLHQIGKFHYLLGINSVNLLLFAGLVGLELRFAGNPTCIGA